MIRFSEPIPTESLSALIKKTACVSAVYPRPVSQKSSATTEFVSNR